MVSSAEVSYPPTRRVAAVFTFFQKSREPPHNVVIFGEAGVGKSSLVNLIIGSNRAGTSSDAVACTQRNQEYEVTIDNRKFRIWDTVGLDSGTFNWLPAAFAERPLKHFLSKLFKKGEVDLLIYCVRASRATRALVRHYQTFYSTICEGAVPVVVVITCLENATGEMENWWAKNEENFRRYGMSFAGHACVTTLGEEQCDSAALRERRTSSRRTVHALISTTSFNVQRSVFAVRVRSWEMLPQRPHWARQLHSCICMRCPAMLQVHKRNVVLAGETGVGKSSLINLIANKNIAGVSNDSLGCTFEIQNYHTVIGRDSFDIWDTPGLDEGPGGAVASSAARNRLRTFLRDISKAGGIHLLLLCTRGWRVTRTLQNTYKTIRQSLPPGIPIAIVVTGLERHPCMNDWWIKNETELARLNIFFDDHACITTV
ncbi:P-loop containing nucleoside triphosphate hydrolase protein, partial [Pisolithus albus]